MSLKKFISITVVVFFVHILIHIIQVQIYAGNFFSKEFNTIAYSIYMPHGTRILFFLIYGFWSIPGMFLAHIINGFNNDEFIALDLIMIEAIFISVFCVPVASLFFRNFFQDIYKNQNFFKILRPKN